MLCYFYYISTLLFQKWGMVKADDFYFKPEFECIGSPHREASQFTSHSNFVCHSWRVMSVLCWPRLLFGIFLPAWNSQHPIFKLIYQWCEDSRNHGEIGTVTCKKNEHFIRWVATQHQMADLNKNFIRSLFYHFLVLLLILSMFNHFIKV